MEHTFQLFLTEIEDGGWGGDSCTYHISLQMLSTRWSLGCWEDSPSISFHKNKPATPIPWAQQGWLLRMPSGDWKDVGDAWWGGMTLTFVDAKLCSCLLHSAQHMQTAERLFMPEWNTEVEQPEGLGQPHAVVYEGARAKSAHDIRITTARNSHVIRANSGVDSGEKKGTLKMWKMKTFLSPVDTQ